MKIIIAGSRDFDNYPLLCHAMDDLLRGVESIEIVSGTCRGADLLGEQYGAEKDIKVTGFPADWSLGKKAGYLRNKQMAEYADALVLFWDGKSRGSKLMLELATQHGLIITEIVT